MPRSDKLSFAPGKRRIVHQDSHPDRRRIDVDKLQRRALFAVGQSFADVNFLEPSQPDDIPGAGMLHFDAAHAREGENPGHASALATASRD